MKLLTIKHEGREVVAALSDDGLWVYPLAWFSVHHPDMLHLIEHWSNQEKDAIESGMQQREGLPYQTVEKCAPIPRPRQDILCLGINYRAHAEESERFNPQAFGDRPHKPVYFGKRVWEAVPDGGVIPAYAGWVQDLDYETELVVVIGKAAYQVPREKAYEHVFGYTILNDVSARTLQTQHGQWYFGKSLDGFAPMGPCIVTRDAIGHPPALALTTHVNGQKRQDANTRDLLFDIAYIIEDLSRGMHLMPGTLIATGTPSGVGMGFDPPRFLQPGDTVVSSIEGIGSLTCQVQG